MLAESSRITTALCDRPVTAGRSERTSANGRAKASGSAIARPVRANSSSASRSRRRAETSCSARSSSSIAANRIGRACRRPMRWMMAGRAAAKQAEQQRGREEVHRATSAPAAARRETRAGLRPAAAAVVANWYSTRASTQMRRQRSRSAADSRSNEAARSRGSTSKRRASPGSIASKSVTSSNGSVHLVGVEDLEQRHVVARASGAGAADRPGRPARRADRRRARPGSCDRPARRRRPARAPARCVPAGVTASSATSRSRMCPPRVRGGRYWRVSASNTSRPAGSPCCASR